MTRLAPAPRNRHETEQSVGTPWDFFRLLDKEFSFTFDLAADSANTKCHLHFNEQDNSLAQDWADIWGWAFLNPPFANIEPWVRKCYEESQRGAKIVALLPASVGSRWFAEWVWGKCELRFLTGRLTFIGHDKPYPKDLMLAIYAKGLWPMVSPWDWKPRAEELKKFALSSEAKIPDSPTIDNHQNDSESKNNLNPVENV